MGIITAQSIPVYNYSYVFNNPFGHSGAIYTDVVRNEPVWTCDDWITFFAKLKSAYGEEEAKSRWIDFWLLGLSSSAGGKGDARAGSGYVYDSVPLDCRSLNSAFRSFMQKYNLSDVIYSGLGNIARPIGVGADIVTNVSDAATTTTKVLKYAIPILIILTTIAIVYRVATIGDRRK